MYPLYRQKLSLLHSLGRSLSFALSRALSFCLSLTQGMCTRASVDTPPPFRPSVCSMCICLLVCLSVCVHVCTFTCTRTRAHTRTRTHAHTQTHTHKTHTHIPKDVTEVEEDIMFIAHYMGRPSTHVSSLRQHQAVVSCFFHFFFPLPSATTKKTILQITLEKVKIVKCADNSEIKKTYQKR